MISLSLDTVIPSKDQDSQIGSVPHTFVECEEQIKPYYASLALGQLPPLHPRLPLRLSVCITQ